MRLVTPGYDDEIGFSGEAIGFRGVAKEFNVLEGLWNARVTSHVPLKDVAGLLTRQGILDNLRLTDDALRAAGIARPRIAVAALNPHAGDNGNFGREEIEVIAPAVEEGKRAQIGCEGPFPADTVFLRARRGDFDAVLTMYHDQGQIAMKLIGFDAGVTLMGGFPFPICTAAHGTAYDIAGKGDRPSRRHEERHAAGRAHGAAGRPPRPPSAPRRRADPQRARGPRPGGEFMRMFPKAAAVLGAALSVALPAAAQPAWQPTRPVEFVVTSGAGGGTDTLRPHGAGGDHAATTSCPPRSSSPTRGRDRARRASSTAAARRATRTR